MSSPPLRFRDDVSTAGWIAPRLHPFGADVGSVIPEGFEAYARLLHPVQLGRASSPLTWTEVARVNGRSAHGAMQLHRILPAVSDRSLHFDGGSVSVGRIPADVLALLIDLLRGHTAAADECWFAVWEGWGGLDDQGVTQRVRHPHRSYLLAKGPIELAQPSSPFADGPSIWWPDDRAWIVATEIDFAWTYVGGTRDLVDALVDDERLEVFEILLTDDPTVNGDRINPPFE